MFIRLLTEHILSARRSGFALILALGFIATLSITVFGLVNQIMLIADIGRLHHDRRHAYHLAQQTAQIGLAQLSTTWFMPAQTSSSPESPESETKKLDPNLIPLVVLNRWQTMTFDPEKDGGLSGTAQLYIAVQEGGLSLDGAARAIESDQAREPITALYKQADTIVAQAFGSTQSAGSMMRFISETVQEAQKSPVLYENIGLNITRARTIWKAPGLALFPQPTDTSPEKTSGHPTSALSDLYTLRTPTETKPTPAKSKSGQSKSPKLSFQAAQDGIALLYLTPIWARIAGFSDGMQETTADRIKRVHELARLKPADKNAGSLAKARLEQWWGLGYAKWSEGLRHLGNPEGLPHTVQIVIRATYGQALVTMVAYAARDHETGRYTLTRCMLDG